MQLRGTPVVRIYLGNPGTDPSQQVIKPGTGQPQVALETSCVIQTQFLEKVMKLIKLCVLPDDVMNPEMTAFGFLTYLGLSQHVQGSNSRDLGHSWWWEEMVARNIVSMDIRLSSSPLFWKRRVNICWLFLNANYDPVVKLVQVSCEHTVRGICVPNVVNIGATLSWLSSPLVMHETNHCIFLQCSQVPECQVSWVFRYTKGIKIAFEVPTCHAQAVPKLWYQIEIFSTKMGELWV